MSNTDLPKREHVYLSEHLDSNRWDSVNFRDKDTIVCTSLKSGTTWMLRIMSLLIHQDPKVDDKVMKMLWPDAAFMGSMEPLAEEIEKLETRRTFKTHLPLDGLPYNEKVKYIQVTRDMRDAFFSLQNHLEIMSDDLLAILDANGDKPFPRFKDLGDVHQRWRDWMTKGTFEWEEDGYPMWSMFSYVETFWPYRHLPNILMVHFTDMLNDLDGEMRRVAKFLDIDVPEEKWPALVEAATFSSMKKDLSTLEPGFNEIFKGGGEAFMDKVDGNWKNILTEEDLALYKARMSKIDPELSEWIERGSLEVGYPDQK